MMARVRTIKEAAQLALIVHSSSLQDASHDDSSILGLLQSFQEIVAEVLWSEARQADTEAIG
jgi:hypothetical protein